MTNQTFTPPKPNVKTVLVRLPTTPTENTDKQFIIRILVVERIRAFMDSLSFEALKEEILLKHLKVPDYYNTDELRDNYFNSERAEIISLYDRIEIDPLFKEDFMSIKDYKGHRWEVLSVTPHAVLLSIEI